MTLFETDLCQANNDGRTLSLIYLNERGAGLWRRPAQPVDLPISGACSGLGRVCPKI
jgi:hypothetical protein